MATGKYSARDMVIIAVLVFLIAMVIVIKTAHEREHARGLTCLNNMKCIAQSLKMYAGDYGDTLPSSRLVSHSKRWNIPDFATFGTTIGNMPLEPRAPRQTWSQILYEHMCCQDTAFCPSDSVDKTNPDARTSYWFKLANDKAWYGIGCPEPRRKTGDFYYESDQIAFYEHSGWHFGDSSGCLGNETKINVSYMDTHVEVIEICNATSGDPINCAANSDGEPMYYNTSANEKGNTKKHDGPAKLTDPTCCYDTL